MKITMLVGSAGVGKSTYANNLSSSIHAEQIAFADYLKYVARLCGWDGLKDLRGRTLLQHLGDVVNEYNEMFWTDYVIYKIIESSGVNHWIITDLRYDREYYGIREAFPDATIKVVKLERSYESTLTEEQRNHISENGVSAEVIDEVINLDEVKYENN